MHTKNEQDNPKESDVLQCRVIEGKMKSEWTVR